ncbi:hypothetical protein V2J09_018220 [Rumex salicifolius]
MQNPGKGNIKTLLEGRESRAVSGDKSLSLHKGGQKEMAKPQLAMDAQFWDLRLATPRNIDSSARAVPGEPIPLDAARASRVHRVAQLSLLGQGFPLGLVPSFSPVSSGKEPASLALQYLPFKRVSVGEWWIAFLGQIRPKQLISKVKSQVSATQSWDVSAFQNLAKAVLDKSTMSSSVVAEIPVTKSSSMILSSENHGETKGPSNRLVYYHELPEHDVSLEAAWPELFRDSKGTYWNVPESISLDLASLDFGSGFRYRFGLHKNGGNPQALDPTADTPPPTLMPGLCAKAAFSYEKSREFWREKETRDDIVIKTDTGTVRRPAYDERLKEPHATVSAIVGGTCGAWLWGNNNTQLGAKIRSPVFADLFGSLCYTRQFGKFRKTYNDLSRIDARLDVCSATAFAKSMLDIFSKSSITTSQETSPSAPRFSLSCQQQIAGPFVLRIDAKYSLHAPWNGLVKSEDEMISLNYSLRALESGKVVAWYSPKRKEGMIELRLYEF